MPNFIYTDPGPLSETYKEELQNVKSEELAKLSEQWENASIGRKTLLALHPLVDVELRSRAATRVLEARREGT